MRLLALLLIAVLGTGCTTMALTGKVDFRTQTNQGEVRDESIIGLLALPTPSNRTVILLPLWKSSTPVEQRAQALPAGIQRWAEENAPSGQNP